MYYLFERIPLAAIDPTLSTRAVLKFPQNFKLSLSDCWWSLISFTPLSIYSRGEVPQYALAGTKNGLRADQKKTHPFLPGIEPWFRGCPARSLFTNSKPSHATVPTKVPLWLHAPCLGKETQGESLRVYDPIGGRRGRYRAGRWETLDLSFCALGVLGPQGRTLESEETEGRYCM